MTLDRPQQPEITQEAIAAAEEILAGFEQAQTGDLIVGGITLTGAEIPAALERYQAKLTALRELQALGFLLEYDLPALDSELITKLEGKGYSYTTQSDLQELTIVSSICDGLLGMARSDLLLTKAMPTAEH